MEPDVAGCAFVDLLPSENSPVPEFHFIFAELVVADYLVSETLKKNLVLTLVFGCMQSNF